MADVQVVSNNTDSILTKNYYAIGDCASSPGWKNAQGAQLEAAGAANKYVKIHDHKSMTDNQPARRDSRQAHQAFLSSQAFGHGESTPNSGTRSMLTLSVHSPGKQARSRYSRGPALWCGVCARIHRQIRQGPEAAGRGLVLPSFQGFAKANCSRHSDRLEIAFPHLSPNWVH